MANPLEQPRPDDLVDQIRAFARDLAYGVTIGAWEHDLYYMPGGVFLQAVNNEANQVYEANFQDLENKWRGSRFYVDAPRALWLDLLQTFGYVKRETPDYSTLTPEAFDLLKGPIVAPTIFISYRRGESSAFALLIEARLRIVGVSEVFIDKSIQAGDDWHGRLQQTIQSCKVFVCLIGPTTLDSEWVRTELQWAVEAGCTIISIRHGGYDFTDGAPQILRDRQSIEVTGESAKEYEVAVNELLNSLGYRTY
jgi:hypothetical protein